MPPGRSGDSAGTGREFCIAAPVLSPRVVSPSAADPQQSRCFGITSTR